MQTDQPGMLGVSHSTVEQCYVLTVHGLLDSSTYRRLRNTVIAAALTVPRAVVVDVNELAVPAPSAWSAFSSARWHVSRWPDVPVRLVCGHDDERRESLAASTIARYLSVHDTIESATTETSGTGRHRYRRHTRTALPRSPASVWQACQLAAGWLRAVALPDLIPAVRTVTAVLTDNVLVHTAGAPAIRLETDGCAVVVAIEDTVSAEAIRHEPAAAGRLSGLEVVATVCQEWGTAPTPSGKTVWALISPRS